MRVLILVALVCFNFAGADLKSVFPSNAAKPIGPYTPGILAGDLMYVSGQGSRTTTADIPTQTRECLENVKAILEGAGLSLAHVVYAQTYVLDIKQYDAMNKVYAEFFPKDPPARSSVAVASLPGGTAVEITVTAVRDLKQRKTITLSGRGMPLSDAVQVGNRVFISGEIPKSDIPKEPRAQLTSLLTRLRSVLAKTGHELRHMAYAHVYVDRSVPLKLVGEVLTEALPSETAVSVVQTNALPRGAHLEISGVASSDLKREGNCTSVGETLYCGGRAGTIEQALKIVNADLESARANLSRVVASRVYIDDIKNFQTMNKVYAGAFAKWLPTRTTLQPTPKAEELTLAPSTDSPPPKADSPRVQIAVTATR